MSIPFSEWQPLVPAEIARVPESPGVFEVATLVRTVLFIGAASENLLAALHHHHALPGHPLMHSGRLYFRYHATDEPERVQKELLAEYRRSHGGALPPAQDTPGPSPGPRRHLKAV